jgi:fructan beta-fructosidase
MTLPREVTLADTARGARLAQKPIRELESLRGRGYRQKNVVVTEDGAVRGRKPPRLDGRTIEIIAEFDALNASEFRFMVRQREEQGDDQQTVIGYDAGTERLFVNRRRSGITGFSKAFSGSHEGPVRMHNGRVRMHIFVDRSSVEVFAAAGKTVITDLIIPRGESKDFEPYAKGSRTLLRSLEAYELDSI